MKHITDYEDYELFDYKFNDGASGSYSCWIEKERVKKAISYLISIKYGVMRAEEMINECDLYEIFLDKLENEIKPFFEDEARAEWLEEIEFNEDVNELLKKGR